MSRPYNLGLTADPGDHLPACVIGIVVTSLVVNRMWKDLDDDPEVQAKIASGELAARHASDAAVGHGAGATGPARGDAGVGSARTRAGLAAAHLHDSGAATRPWRSSSASSRSSSSGCSPTCGPLGGRRRDRADRHDQDHRAGHVRRRRDHPVPRPPRRATVPDQSVFKAGMISAIALFGIAWLTATFIAAHEEYIIDTIGEWVTTGSSSSPWRCSSSRR